MNKNNIKKDVEIIKPYLISKGYDFNSYNDYDFFSYSIARKDNMRYLSFGICRYKGIHFWEPDYSYQCGQIIYDIDGKILLDCVKGNSINTYFDRETKEIYNELDSSNIFMDDYAVITRIKNSFEPYYSIYKLENGNYSHKGEYGGMGTMLEKTSGGELFLNKNGRLHGVRKFKHLNSIKFRDIIGVGLDKDSLRFSIEYLCSSYPFDIIDNIINVLNNNNLLFAYDYVNSDKYCSNPNRATIFTFLDTKGDIASKLFVKEELDFYLMDVDNRSYEEVKETIKKGLDDKYEKEMKKTKKKKTKNHTLSLKSKEDMINSLSSRI